MDIIKNNQMSIIIFQIIIVLVIFYASSQGFGNLIVATGILLVFTVAMVKTSPLIIIQFATIILSFLSCIKNRKKRKESPQIIPVKIKQYRKKGLIEIIFRILLNFAIIVIALFGFYKWIKFSFSENDSYLIFLGILNLLLFGAITYVVVFFLYGRIKDLWLEFEQNNIIAHKSS